MIFTPIPRGTVFYRALTPRWAHMPNSGAGAARVGGRFNAPGIHALYLSQTPEVALREYQQHDAQMPASTICSYNLTLDRVIDFTGGHGPSWPPAWADAYCNFRTIAGAGKTPPSWDLGAQAVAEGASGILFRSALTPDGINLVVFTLSMGADDSVAVYDPNGLLPNNPSSWAPPSP